MLSECIEDYKFEERCWKRRYESAHRLPRSCARSKIVCTQQGWCRLILVWMLLAGIGQLAGREGACKRPRRRVCEILWAPRSIRTLRGIRPVWRSWEEAGRSCWRYARWVGWSGERSRVLSEYVENWWIEQECWRWDNNQRVSV